MNRYLTNILMIWSCFILSGGPVYAGAVEWSTGMKEEGNALVVTGVATGSTLEAAQRDALLNATTHIAIYVAMTFEIKGVFLRNELERRLREEIVFSSPKMPIPGGLPQKWECKEMKSGYYCLITIRYLRGEVEMMKSRLQTELAEQMARAQTALRQAKATVQSGHFMEVVQRFAQAMQLGQSAGNTTVALQAREELHNFLNAIEITSLFNEETPIIPSSNPLPLKFKVTLQYQGKSIPLQEVPLKFILDKRAAASGRTNLHGEAKLRWTFLNMPPGQTQIMVKLDSDAIFSGPDKGRVAFNEEPLLGTLVRTFTVVVTPKQRSRVAMASSNGASSEWAGGSILQALSHAGFRVVEREDPLADMKIYFRTSLRNGSENVGGIISMYAHVSVEAETLKNGEWVARQTETVVGFGSTQEMAEVDAMQAAIDKAVASLIEQLIRWEEQR